MLMRNEPDGVCDFDRWNSPSVPPWLIWCPFVLMVALTFATTPDDPLITLRYAANIWSGHELAFNHGDRVEGFSSILHLALQSLAWVVPGGLHLFKAKLVSVLFGALAVYESHKLIDALEWGYVYRLLATLLVATSWPIAVSSANALETTMAMWLVVLVVRRLFEPGYRLQAEVVVAVATSALVLTRPEASLIVGSLGLASAIVASAGGGRGVWKRCRWVVWPVSTAVALTVSRLWYFGYAFPNTYYAKSIELGEAIPRGVNYLVYGAWFPVRQSLIAPGWKIAIPDDRVLVLAACLGTGLLILVAVGVASSPWWLSRRGLIISAPVVAQMSFVIITGGDWMLGGRFLVPVLPLVIVLQVRAVWLFRHFRIVVVAAVATLVAVIPLQLRDGMNPAWNIDSLAERGLVFAGGYERHSEKWVVGAEMLECVPTGSTVAYSEMGLAPCVRRDLRFVDLAGLVNEDIAHAIHDGHEPGDWSSERSVAGKEIIRSGADYLLMATEGQGASVLGGQFHLVDERSVPFHMLRLYQRENGTCG